MKIIFSLVLLALYFQSSYQIQCPRLHFDCNGTCLPPWAGPCTLATEPQVVEDTKIQCPRLHFECNGTCLPPWAGPCTYTQAVEVAKDIAQETTEATECCGPVRPSYTNPCPTLRYECNGACVPAWYACTGTSSSQTSIVNCPEAQAPCNGGCIPIWARCQSIQDN